MQIFRGCRVARTLAADKRGNDSAAKADSAEPSAAIIDNPAVRHTVNAERRHGIHKALLFALFLFALSFSTAVADEVGERGIAEATYSETDGNPGGEASGVGSENGGDVKHTKLLVFLFGAGVGFIIRCAGSRICK